MLTATILTAAILTATVLEVRRGEDISRRF